MPLRRNYPRGAHQPAASETSTLLKGGKRKISLRLISALCSLLRNYIPLLVGGLVRRQISTSLSSLHDRTLVIPYRPLSLSQYYCYKRQRPARYVKKCLGWHFECRTRRVTTLWISTTHRTLAGFNLSLIVYPYYTLAIPLRFFFSHLGECSVLALSEREVSSSISSNFMLDTRTRLRRHRHSGISSPLCCVHYSGFYTDEFPLISLPKIEIFYDFCTFICIIEYFFVPLQPIMSYHMLIENRMFNFTPPL